jgi:predicted rRNA methylase YqxC with S4 and FtsJ domains
MTDEERTAWEGELAGNVEALHLKFRAMYELMLEKGIFTKDEFHAKVQAVVEREAAQIKQEMEEISWEEILHKRRKQ